MPTFGQKLRQERESRNTRIQDIAARSGIEHRYLEALEENDFDALPGPRGFGKLYIRAYAQVLGFDPQPMIDEFEKERRKRTEAVEKSPRSEPARVKRIHYVPPPRKPAKAKPPEPTPEPVVSEPEPAPKVEVAEVEPEATPKLEVTETEPAAVEPLPPTGHASAKPGLAGIVTVVLIAGVLLVVGVVTLRPTSETPAPADVPEPEIATVQPAPVHSVPTAPDVEELAPTMTVPAGIRIAESGVGDAVVDHRLVGEAELFAEGSTVYFFTRVTGVTSEQNIRHVWLHEGRVVQSRSLPVRSANWRTHSGKTLWARGNWVVEARDVDDRVLARVEFRCTAE